MRDARPITRTRPVELRSSSVAPLLALTSLRTGCSRSLGCADKLGMDDRSPAPFSYAEVRPYDVARALEELHGPEHGTLRLPSELAWSGRTEFDLDDSDDRTAVYKIVLEEDGVRHLRELLNGKVLRAIWRDMRPARPVRALWESHFPELRQAS
jgi:hypothetical protein